MGLFFKIKQVKYEKAEFQENNFAFFVAFIVWGYFFDL